MGAANISIPARGDKPPIKEPPKGTNPSTTREPTQTEGQTYCTQSRRSGTITLNIKEFLPYKFTFQRQLAMQNIRKHRFKQRESTKMRRCNQKEWKTPH